MAAPIPSPYGPPITTPPPTPPDASLTLHGKYCSIVPASPSHAAALFPVLSHPSSAGLFTYLYDTPPTSIDELSAHLATKAASTNPWFYTVLAPHPVGVLALMRMDLPNRSIEVGHILFLPELQRTRAATEAIYLLARHVFTAGFLRFEWKCHSLNVPSRRAAQRFGFAYEGTFRRHMVFKGTSRDTAWFAMTDDDWPRMRAGWEAWLDDGNFDTEGRQKKRLEECREVI